VQETFRDSSVDGAVLLTLTDADLQGALRITNPLVRRKILLAVLKLRDGHTPRPRPTPRIPPAAASSGKPQVFISYSHSDLEAVLCCVHELRGLGWSCWVDSKIRVGTTWRQSIAQAIDDAGVMVSEHSMFCVTQHILAKTRY